MSDINQVIIEGNIGSCPKVSYFGKDKPVIRFSVATNRSFINENGQMQKKTDWHTVVIFGALAKWAKPLEKNGEIRKGVRVRVEGRIETRKYKDNYYTEIIVDDACGLLMTNNHSSDEPHQ